VDGVWEPAKTKGCEILIPSDTGSPTPILSLDPHESKKTLGVRDCPAGGSKSHLKHIQDKVNAWIDKMKNGHLPSSMGWIAYKFQLWPGVRYGIGTMTNDLEEAEEFLDKTDHRMLNVLGIARAVKKGWRRIHSTFVGFGLFTFVTEQLIERLNLLLQHYNTGSSISKKLDASLRYLQLQIGTNIYPLDLPYDT
jgi:hypothetical protein